MATLSDSLVSSSARVLPIRKRTDLTAKRERYLGKSYWIVKDPVGLKYFRFQDEEYAILQMLDGNHSLDDIKEQFQKEFPPQKIKLEELQRFIGMLHQSGLILTGAQDQGYQLYKRSLSRRRKELLAAFSNILCIRFKGFDPEWLLTAMYPYVAWFFSPLAMFCWITMMISAFLLVMMNIDMFYAKLPSFYQFFTPENTLWLAVVLGCTKVIHEFGHGLTCKHFGGECHEMGVMILVLTPCLYCNATDSWMLPSKWKRAGIGFAGIFVELWLASIATFVWWYSNPGLLHNICLNIMFISSVSTVIFNANPLLKYDGYYVLADLLEIPNLRQKASSICNRKMGEWCLGLEYPEDPFLPQRNQVIFAIYAIASVCYRWVVTCSIMMFLLRVFKPYGLKILGQAIIAMSLFGLVVMPIYKLCKFFYVPGRTDKVKKVRLYISLALVAAFAYFLIFVPLPYRLFVPAEIQYDGGDTIYVVIPGTISHMLVKPGDEVKKGDPLVVLENNDLEIQIRTLTDEILKTEVELRTQLELMAIDSKNSLQIPAIEETLQALKLQLAERRMDQARLTLRATRDGVVLPPTYRIRREPDDFLPTWFGSPFDLQNSGAYLDTGDAFCQIGDTQKMKATLIVTQSQKDFVHADQKVDVNLNELPGRVFTGSVKEVAGQELKAVSPRLSNKHKGEVSTTTERDGTEKPQIPSYKVDVPLDNTDGLMYVGLTGQAKIYAKPQTVVQRVWRVIAETFNFKL